LRDFLEKVDAAGQMLRIDGVDWNLEMGGVAEIVSHARSEAPAVLFDNIPGYPQGFRVLSGGTNSARRVALAMNLPEPTSAMELVRAYRDRMKTHAPIPHRVVEHGPVLENVDRDDAVDLYKFPVPRVHEEDGGRYIGTHDLVIMRDPDSEWVNAGTYRVQVHDKTTVGIYISPGKHGRQIRDKYFERGQPCPVLISCGQHPVLTLAGNHDVPHGVTEFDYAGGHRGSPIEVIKSELYGLPTPADAEIVLEGEMVKEKTALEGPFGEFTGYYANPQAAQPIVKIRRVYYRNNPILTLAVPMRPPTDLSYGKCIIKSAMIWDEVEKAGLSGVKGVWCHEAGIGRLFNVISIKQAYAGHARQAGMLAANVKSGNYLGRFVVVVDDDVDPTDMFDVLWVMSTRCDPIADIDFLRGAWSSPLDPMVERGAKSYTNSRAVIDACRPFDRLKTFPKVARATPELLARVREKFGALLPGI
jgi:4-hydroxy-3-polyprenylbenzoate decarboxylase